MSDQPQRRYPIEPDENISRRPQAPFPNQAQAQAQAASVQQPPRVIQQQVPQGGVQRPPEPARAATRPPVDDDFDEEEEEEISPVREWFANMQPYAIIAMGLAMIIYGIIATAVIGSNDMANFTNNVYIQFGVAGFGGLCITGIEIFAISTRSKYSRDLYWGLMFIDVLYTARWNNNFSIQLMQSIPFAPIILMTSVTWIGFHAHVKDHIYAKIYTAITVLVLGSFLLISRYLENKDMLFVAVYAIDIIGAYWTARIGEEFAFGKRID